MLCIQTSEEDQFRVITGPGIRWNWNRTDLLRFIFIVGDDVLSDGWQVELRLPSAVIGSVGAADAILARAGTIRDLAGITKRVEDRAPQFFQEVRK